MEYEQRRGLAQTKKGGGRWEEKEEIMMME